MTKQWLDKVIVGLTGNIATGKSAVMRMASEKGALTLDADKIVHEILEEDPSMQAAIAVAFGPGVRREDGRIDRAALAEIVFSDAEALRDLEMMLHPAVRQEIRERIDDSDASVVFVEAIKLLEGELVDLVDQIWVTRAARRTQIERLMVCRGMEPETAALRVNAQSSQEAKVARADVVIETEGTMADTATQFEFAWSRLPAPDDDFVPRVRRAPPAPPAETRREPSARSQVEAPAASAPVAAPASAPEPSTAASLPVSEDVVVRRARPSDIPAVLLLLHRASEGKLKMKRSDLLLALSERSYLIGQDETEINMVVGWSTHSTTAVTVDQIFAHPAEVALRVGPAVLAEVEKSARQLICEIVFVFLPHDVTAPVRQLLESSGYQPMQADDMRRAWKTVIGEMQPEGTFVMGKVMRDVRIG